MMSLQFSKSYIDSISALIDQPVTQCRVLSEAFFIRIRLIARSRFIVLLYRLVIFFR